jgi:hypothetical protein
MTPEEIDFIRSAIEYDPLTGEMKRRDEKYELQKRIGKNIMIGGKLYSRARVAYACTFSGPPPKRLFFLNGDCTDFRIKNITTLKKLAKPKKKENDRTDGRDTNNRRAEPGR